MANILKENFLDQATKNFMDTKATKKETITIVKNFVV